MALKGTATIELTDVHTGRKEVIKHDNLVTNAVRDILTMNPLGFRFGNYSNSALDITTTTDQHDEMGTSFADAMLPVCPNLIGGVLLHEKALDENPDKYYADTDNPLIGYSSNDVNGGTDPMRGSMNLSESGPLEDGKGYRFVFDFSTSQANGTISSLGLTSARGGKAGYGSEHDHVGYQLLCVGGFRKVMPLANGYDFELHKVCSVISADWESGIGIYATIDDANTITVGKCALISNSLGVFQEIGIPTKISETQIVTKNFASNVERQLSIVDPNSSTGSRVNVSNSCGACLIDGGDGYIWGFQHANNADGNSSGNADVQWIKIRKEDFSFEEGTWSIAAQLAPFAYAYVKPYYYNRSSHPTAIIDNGKLYALAQDQHGVYVIDLSNPSNVSLLECSFPIDIRYGPAYPVANYYCGRVVEVTKVFGTITYRNAFIRCGKIIQKYRRSSTYVGFGFSQTSSNNTGISANGALSFSSGSLAEYGPFKICICSDQYYKSAYSNSYADAIIYLMTPYLATINNLETPVTKTADKTMKITYILREE